jgi:hypothetical protein
MDTITGQREPSRLLADGDLAAGHPSRSERDYGAITAVAGQAGQAGRAKGKPVLGRS